ncbi:MAG: ECF transporter S component [Bacilli bacterium]
MKRTHRLVLASLFVALSFIFTYFVKIPFPTGGYFNVGDAFIMLAAIIIDPLTGILVGALAGGLSDLFAGYVLFIPFTVLAKGLEALIAGFIYQKTRGLLRYVGVVIGPLVMVALYALSYVILFDKATMIANLPFDLAQAGIAIVLTIILLLLLEKTPLLLKVKARK